MKKERYGRGGKSFKVFSEGSADLSLALTVLSFYRLWAKITVLYDQRSKGKLITFMGNVINLLKICISVSLPALGLHRVGLVQIMVGDQRFKTLLEVLL